MNVTNEENFFLKFFHIPGSLSFSLAAEIRIRYDQTSVHEMITVSDSEACNDGIELLCKLPTL